MALRVDITPLRAPKELPDGSVMVDGYLTRVGVFAYPNSDGTERRELRLPEEVFRKDTLESFQLRPVTNDHPPDLVNSHTARQYQVGTVGENVTPEGEYVRARLAVNDAATIAQMKAGKSQLSCGYEVDLDETPGVHPVYGRYDAIQRKIRGNHVAIVSKGRAGESARVRMDARTIEHADADLTAAERNNLPGSSFGVPSTGQLPLENAGHVRAAMARFNQTHFQTPEERKSAYHRIVRKAKELGIDSSGFEKEYGGRMDDVKVTLEKLAAETKRADAAQRERDEAKAAADEAKGQLETLKEQLASLEKVRKDAEAADGQIRVLKAKLEEAEAARIDAQNPERLRKAVAARARLETQAAGVLGGQRFDAYTDRELMTAVLDRLGKSADLKDASDAYVKGRFDTAIEQYNDGEKALDALRSSIRADTTPHAMDIRSPRDRMIAFNRGDRPQEQK